MSTLVRDLREEQTGQAGSTAVESKKIRVVKVFSATRAKDRDALGDSVTAWIANNRDLRVVKASVTLSSDEAFHCLTIVLFCSAI
jgi:hypothetical protein